MTQPTVSKHFPHLILLVATNAITEYQTNYMYISLIPSLVIIIIIQYKCTD